MGEWPVVRLGEVAQLFDAPHQTAPTTPDGPVVYLNVGDIRNGRIELRLSGRLTSETADAWSKRVVPSAGDVVFGYEATVGDAALLTDDHRWALGRRVGLLRPDTTRVNPRFLAYSWYSPRFQDTLRAHRVGGTTIESIRLTELPGWTIALPHLGEQRRIAGILGALDDKIELNRRMAETLERTVQIRFEREFCAGDSADEPVPLGDVAVLVRDSVDPRTSPGVVFDHYSLPAFDDGRGPARDRGDTIRSVKTRVPVGAILVSKLNPAIGRVWYPDVGPGYPAISSTEFLVLMPIAPAGRQYLYALARSEPFRRAIQALATGTSGSHQRAQAGSVMSIPVPRPAPARVARFDLFAGPMLERSLAARRESRFLAEARDALLSRLLSGELTA